MPFPPHQWPVCRESVCHSAPSLCDFLKKQRGKEWNKQDRKPLGLEDMFLTLIDDLQSFYIFIF